MKQLVPCLGVAIVLGVAVASAGVWVTKAPMPQVRAQHGLAAVNGRLYAVGGGRAACHTAACYAMEVEEYDPVTDAWIDRAATFVRKNHATVAVGDDIYVVGGDNDSVRFDSLQAYHPASDTWSSLPAMPTPRSFPGAAALDGVIYVLGGLTGTSGATGASVAVASNEAYDIATGTWSSRTPMPAPRYGVSVAALDGELYVLGGSVLPSGAILNVVDAYDPASGTWRARAPMPDARAAFATVAHGGRLFVIGGFRPGVGALTSVLIYDAASDTWSDGPDLNVARGSHAAAVLDGLIYAAGGLRYTSAGAGLEYYASLEVLDPLDITPPEITSIAATPPVLWPPNHQMVDVSVTVAATDNADPSPRCAIAGISSNEPADGPGDGGAGPDITFNGLQASLRAERAATGGGRIYTITVTCTDASDNGASATVSVTVPHDLGR